MSNSSEIIAVLNYKKTGGNSDLYSHVGRLFEYDGLNIYKL